MAEKKTHFGRAGEFFAMSELLLRGWNVAVPVVDIGDDVFVIDDNDKATRRLQVKSTTISGANKASFSLSRKQLRTQLPIELYYMLLIRLPASKEWRFLVIPRKDLDEIRRTNLSDRTEPRGRGRPPVADDQSAGDALNLTIALSADEAIGWGVSLKSYLDTWPDDLGIVATGPGSVAGKA